MTLVTQIFLPIKELSIIIGICDHVSFTRSLVFSESRFGVRDAGRDTIAILPDVQFFLSIFATRALTSDARTVYKYI